MSYLFRGLTHKVSTKNTIKYIWFYEILKFLSRSVLCTGIWTYSFQGLLDHLHSVRTLWFYPDIKQTRQYLVTGFLCQFSIKFTSDLLICKIKIHNVINIVTLTQERRFHFHHLNHICTAMLYILKSENSSHCLTEIELTKMYPL